MPKAFVELRGRPLLRWALDQALGCPEVGRLVVVAPASWLVAARDIVAEALAESGRGPCDEEPGVRVDVVVGGEERRESVSAGLGVLGVDDGLVLVHDAARALTPPALFSRVVDALRSGHGAVVPGLPVADTIKTVDEAGTVVSTLDRGTLRAIQTPQGFVREVLVHAHEENLEVAVTDDAGLVELTGTPIHVVDGEAWAAKITTPEDLDAAERRLATVGGRP
ncbi:2-C-methyl-D-erythritol 4-phosphate cytidylyltransferase [Mobilicoccus pelagius]|uniref:2-C-methyl-D-erythritol 4-phosphate cytidylyltransferase n=1 Tax=Mobilicoccus pelagius NBRC 104925 TaxID=1089455 RepID=H5UN64_9MICO|nr:2-C-methyl-D-erythritol 4-phosphate cytidylyltransferase [Mobilicoccus pelagius]GAB47172.1 2-C-methyl-D-erythritol 4-phosphate cytidylyltransferase [Mobilicoccus pelagius NBRC 104925]